MTKQKRNRYIIDLWEVDSRPVWELLQPIAINMWVIPQDEHGNTIPTASREAHKPPPEAPHSARPQRTVPNKPQERSYRWVNRVWEPVRKVLAQMNGTPIRYDDDRIKNALAAAGYRAASASAFFTAFVQLGLVNRESRGMYVLPQKEASDER